MLTRAWVLFWLLGIVWGSSYLLMRVGVVEIPPAQLALIRVGIAAVCTNALVLLTRRRYPTDWKTLRALAILGLGNSAIPFTLLAWGEQTVESGLTSVIQAVMPLFAVIIAHFAFADERLTPYKIAGVALGFGGIIVLSLGESFGGKLEGQIAILIASLCYAVSINFARKMLRALDPVTMAAVTLTSATVGAAVIMVGAPLIGERGPVALNGLSTDVLWSVLVLGFLNTFLAYLLYYRIIADLGASRASMVAFVIPVVAVTLGGLILGERVDARLLAGGALILGGIAIANQGAVWRHKLFAAAQAQEQRAGG